MCKSDSIFLNLQSSMVSKWLFKFISWQSSSQKWIITVPEEKHQAYLAEENLGPRAKITTIFRL